MHAAVKAVLNVQSPEYVEVNVTVDCVDGSKEEARQPAAGLSTFLGWISLPETPNLMQWYVGLPLLGPSSSLRQAMFHMLEYV